MVIPASTGRLGRERERERISIHPSVKYYPIHFSVWIISSCRLDRATNTAKVNRVPVKCTFRTTSHRIAQITSQRRRKKTQPEMKLSVLRRRRRRRRICASDSAVGICVGRGSSEETSHTCIYTFIHTIKQNGSRTQSVRL